MSYGYRVQLNEVLNELIGRREPFTAKEVTDAIHEMFEESGGYHDPVGVKRIQTDLMRTFEKGDMPGYCITVHPFVDEDGYCFMGLGFEPFNPMDPLDIILEPEEGEGEDVKCNLHLHLKRMLDRLAEKADCSEEDLVRSILIRGIQLIYDEMD